MQKCLLILTIAFQFSMGILGAQNVSLQWDKPIADLSIFTHCQDGKVYAFSVSYDKFLSYLLTYDEEGNRIDSIAIPALKYISNGCFSAIDSTFLLIGYTYDIDSVVVSKCNRQGDVLWVKDFGIDGYESFASNHIGQNSTGQILVSLDMSTPLAGLSSTGYLLLDSDGEKLDMVNTDTLDLFHYDNQ